MTDWQMGMLNLQPVKIPEGMVPCAYCGKPVPQPRKSRIKRHCNPSCMRRMQIIERNKQREA